MLPHLIFYLVFLCFLLFASLKPLLMHVLFYFLLSTRGPSIHYSHKLARAVLAR